MTNEDKDNIVRALYAARAVLTRARRLGECCTMDVISLNRISAEIDYWECCDLPLTCIPGDPS